MKGIVFTEFLDMVEGQFGLDTTEKIIERSALPNGGAYTSVGTYDHGELAGMVGHLSAITGIAPPALVRAFGEHMFPILAAAHPHVLAGVNSCFGLLEIVESGIHKEVRKLYPNAELPEIRCRRLDEARLEVTYRSARPFADLAEGLIRGCARHFGESVALEREDQSVPAGHAARFTLTATPAGRN